MKRFGSYRIIRRLWSRDDGVSCFLAEQLPFERKVELRLFGTGLSEQSSAVERFIREFKLLARLDHPRTDGLAANSLAITDFSSRLLTVDLSDRDRCTDAGFEMGYGADSGE